MSTTIAKPLFNTQLLPTTTTKMYQAPSATYTIIDKLTVTNQDTGANTFTIYIVPSGQSAGPSNIVTSAYSVSAGQTYVVPDIQSHILAPGDAIFMLASKASVMTARGSGREVS